MADRIRVARIGAAHGIRGEVKLWSFTEDPLAVTNYGPLETEDGARRFEIEAARPAKDHLVARLKGIGDRNAAETLRNTDLFVPRDRLPPIEEADTFYHADLVGLSAVGEDGAALGTVIAIHNFGAGDLIEIDPAAGGEPTVAAVQRDDGADDRSEGGTHRRRAAGRDRGEGRRLTMWRASILTIFPEMFPGPLGVSLAGKALASGIWSLDTHDIRDAATDKHRTVDDTPAGGGPGMVMKADVLARALDTVPHDQRPRLLMSPRGAPLTQARAAHAGRRAWRRDRLRPLRRRRRAADQGPQARGSLARRFRALGRRAGGDRPARCLRAAAARRHGQGGLDRRGELRRRPLEYPQYTRPPVFEGEPIPDVLLSGDHGKIAAWRRAEAERLTRERRPDLWAAYLARKKPKNGPKTRG